MKIIVAHPGRQHSFRIAKALKESGLLYKYVTTVYNKDNSLLMRLTKLFLSKENQRRAEKRKCPSLLDDDVVQFCELDGLLLLALYRIDSKRKFLKAYTRYISAKFQRKLVDYIIKEKVDIVISYDTNSRYLFDALKKRAPHVIRVIDHAHPNRHFLYHNYREHWNAVGNFVKTLEACGYLTDATKAAVYGEEAKLANYHIVASSYSQKALEFEGISPATIFKIPYGVDKDKFLRIDRSYSNQSLKALFIGDVNQRKGIKQLLDAAEKTFGTGICFNIIGVGHESFPELFQAYAPYVNYLGYVSFDELLAQLKNNQVFVFPTMGEGFGLVLLEAMAAGLPVITTPNCAGYDIVQDGVNGFIIPVGETTTLVEKLLWLKNNPEQLSTMSANAVRTAKLFTWEKYEQGIVSSLLQISKRIG